MQFGQRGRQQRCARPVALAAATLYALLAGFGVSTRRALAAVDQHPRFGINFDPSHFGYQGVDYLKLVREFAPRICNVHVKDS